VEQPLDDFFFVEPAPPPPSVSEAGPHRSLFLWKIGLKP
jgi:hypothetical protein